MAYSPVIVHELSGLSESVRKLALDQFRLLQPHFEQNRPLRSVYMVKGQLLLMQNARGLRKAQQCFGTALGIARDQKAKSDELTAVIHLARLLASRGRRDEARTMLAEIYGWFTEGFDTRDLKDAKALLNELST